MASRHQQDRASCCSRISTFDMLCKASIAEQRHTGLHEAGNPAAVAPAAACLPVGALTRRGCSSAVRGLAGLHQAQSCSTQQAPPHSVSSRHSC